MAAVVLGGDTMGPEHIFPNQTEEVGPHQGPTEGTGDWSSEEPEDEQEETGAGPAGYSYQPLNQDPEQEEVELAPVGDGEDVVADIQDRIQVCGGGIVPEQVEQESLKNWPWTVFLGSAGPGASFAGPTTRKWGRRWAGSYSIEQPQLYSHGPR